MGPDILVEAEQEFLVVAELVEVEQLVHLVMVVMVVNLELVVVLVEVEVEVEVEVMEVMLSLMEVMEEITKVEQDMVQEEAIVPRQLQQLELMVVEVEDQLTLHIFLEVMEEMELSGILFMVQEVVEEEITIMDYTLVLVMVVCMEVGVEEVV